MNSGTALGLLGMYSACASVGVIATVALRTGLSAPTGPAKTIASCVPVTFVMAACVALFYAFAFNQSSTAWTEHARLKSEAKKAGEKPPKFNEVKYGTLSTKLHNANRTLGNFWEQLVPFLVSLLGYALFVDANRAAVLGWAWLFFRSYYPFLFALPFPGVLASTVPAYWCVWWMVGATVLAAARL